VAATQWPQAEVDDRDAGPGIVWERRVSLLLPVGTVLLRLETRPSRAPARSPLDYLTRELKTAERQTLRTRWIVGPRGSLASQTAR
jgi:hypothetical protein